jgi:hypothetical protein
VEGLLSRVSLHLLEMHPENNVAPPLGVQPGPPTMIGSWGEYSTKELASQISIRNLYNTFKTSFYICFFVLNGKACGVASDKKKYFLYLQAFLSYILEDYFRERKTKL